MYVYKETEETERLRCLISCLCMADAVVFLNSRADDQVRSIQLLVHRFLRGDEGEDADEDVMYMSKQFRILYGYDPWTPLAASHR